MSSPSSITNPFLIRARDLLSAHTTPELAFASLTKSLANRPLAQEMAIMLAYRQALSSTEGKKLCNENKRFQAFRGCFYGDITRAFTYFDKK